MGCIYKLDFASGKSYIGLTVRPVGVRLSQHRTASKKQKDDFAVYRAWRKHGEPTLTVLCEAEGEELKQAERDAIKEFNTIVPNGYNLGIGGDSPVWSAETRQKMSIAHKGRKKSEAHKRNIGLGHKGRVFSDDTKAKMKDAQNSRDPSTRNDISHFWSGKKQSEEHLKKRFATYHLTVANRQLNRMMDAIL